MQLEVGKIYEGKVTGITKFGAFVELDKDTTGMVHISEVANTFVNEIKDHLTEGQTVKVKVLNLGDDGKISLSIKKAQPAPQRKPRENGHQGGREGRPNGGQRISTVREAILRADPETTITGITTETERRRILLKIRLRYTMLTAIQETLILRICSASSRRQARKDFPI